MKKVIVIFVLSIITSVLIIWTHPSFANFNEVDATCEDGLTFVMERAEVNTRVTATRDGVSLFANPIVVSIQNGSVIFSDENPDKTRPHSWVIFVDSEYNEDQTIIRSVGSCITPPAVTTTVPTSTTTANTVPVTTISTVITTPSNPSTTVTNTTPTTLPDIPTKLPATGPDVTILVLIGAAALGLGLAILFWRDLRKRL